MRDRAAASVMASFIGDALALGVHWEYSTRKLRQEFGRVDSYLDPGPGSYHRTRKKGEFTHYGDQAYVLLESVASSGAFDAEDFSRRWRRLFEDYDGYLDQATRTTLENLSRGVPFLEAGSPSNDLSAASRVAPLVYALHSDEEALAEAARTQAMLTHTDALTVAASEFFARAALMVLRGARPREAMEFLAGGRFSGTALAEAVAKGMATRGEDTIETVKGFGQDCHSPHALPSVAHIVASYQDDLEEALVQNVMAGGDSAARGMIVGMLLGAHLGMQAIPRRWIDGLVRGPAVMGLLDRIG